MNRVPGFYGPPRRAAIATCLAVTASLVLYGAARAVSAFHLRHASGYLESTTAWKAFLPFSLEVGLTRPNSLVVFGSSELSMEDEPNLPQLFFPREAGVPVFAFGHAGMQSLSILARLFAHQKNLGGASLVIMVGPGWFLDRPPLERFLEAVSQPISTGILQASWHDPVAMTYLSKYVDEQLVAIENPSPSMQAIAAYTGSPWAFPFLAAKALFLELPGVVESTLQIMIASWSPGTPYILAEGPHGTIDAFPWRDRQLAANARQVARSRGNSAFVEDGYFQRVVTDTGREFPLALAAPELDGREMADFTALVAFLVRTHASPLFVIEGFNARAYKDLDSWRPLLSKLRSVLYDAGFPCVDLWEDRYQPGAYFDVQHIGSYSWLEVDRQITRLFNERRLE